MEIAAPRARTATLALLMISWGCGEGLTGPPETAGRDVDAFVASRGCRVDGCSGGGGPCRCVDLLSCHRAHNEILGFAIKRCGYE